MHCTTAKRLQDLTTTMTGAAGCNRRRPFLFQLARMPRGDDAGDDAGDDMAKGVRAHHAASGRGGSAGMVGGVMKSEAEMAMPFAAATSRI